MKKKTLIIDGDNNLYRAYYKFQNFSTIDGKPTGVIYGFLTILMGLMRQFNPDNVIVAFDGRKSPMRLLWLPGYKKRENKNLSFNPEIFYEQKDKVKFLLSTLGITVIWNEKEEADDLIYLLTKKHIKDQITIVSRDKDFNQLISRNVSIWDGQEQVLLTKKNLQHRRGYKPTQCVDYLSLLGDKSDNIPGYSGIGEKKALKFLEDFGYINNFLESEKEFKGIDKSELKVLWERNRKIIDLRFYQKTLGHNIRHKEILNPQIETPNYKRAKSLLTALEIKLLNKEENIDVFRKYHQRKKP